MAVLKICLSGLAVTMITACVSTGDDLDYGEGQSISVPYNPYDYDPDDLLAEAQAHCSAYGLSASYDGETVDPGSVRWRYRHYRCV